MKFLTLTSTNSKIVQENITDEITQTILNLEYTFTLHQSKMITKAWILWNFKLPKISDDFRKSSTLSSLEQYYIIHSAFVEKNCCNFGFTTVDLYLYNKQLNKETLGKIILPTQFFCKCENNKDKQQIKIILKLLPLYSNSSFVESLMDTTSIHKDLCKIIREFLDHPFSQDIKIKMIEMDKPKKRYIHTPIFKTYRTDLTDRANIYFPLGAYNVRWMFYYVLKYYQDRPPDIFKALDNVIIFGKIFYRFNNLTNIKGNQKVLNQIKIYCKDMTSPTLPILPSYRKIKNNIQDDISQEHDLIQINNIIQLFIYNKLQNYENCIISTSLLTVDKIFL